MTTLSSKDSPASTQDVVVHAAGSAGAATWAMGSLFERLVRACDTGGQLGVSVVTQPAGAASPLHVHTREAEAWYVLDGEMTYVAGPETVRMVAGDFIYLPRDVPHAFRVTGGRPARFLALSLPGQLLDLYDEVGGPAWSAGFRTVESLPTRCPGGEISARYGIRVVGPPIPETGPDAASPSTVRHHTASRKEIAMTATLRRPRSIPEWRNGWSGSSSRSSKTVTWNLP